MKFLLKNFSFFNLLNKLIKFIIWYSRVIFSQGIFLIIFYVFLIFILNNFYLEWFEESKLKVGLFEVMLFVPSYLISFFIINHLNKKVFK